MTKTFALLLDSYRELNAKRLFWIVLALSGLVVLVFAAVGLRADTITFLWFDTPIKSGMLNYLDPAKMYELMFTAFGVNVWLSWIATILALVSTGGIFPDFMAGGSIDLYLAKPISRLRLFLTKYFGGMLFVTLQVGIFSSLSFLVLGLRGHAWEPKVFLAIPLVLAVFSYLFSVCVLLGVTTRSTVASVMLTLLFWFGLWGVQRGESVLLEFSIRQDARALSLDREIAATQRELQRASSTHPTTASFDENSQSGFAAMIPFGLFSRPDSKQGLRERIDRLQNDRQKIGKGLTTAHHFVYAALTLLPKTEATTELLTRALISDGSEGSEAGPAPDFSEPRGNRREERAQQEYWEKQVQKELDKRTPLWILGTSFGFEILIVCLAAWLFCRRDY